MENKKIAIRNLMLDKDNFRHPHADSEIEIVNLLNTANGTLYHGLLKSFLAEGYLPTENILVIKVGQTGYRVAEGNRRVSLLKLIHGLIDVEATNLSQTLKNDIHNAPTQLKRDTGAVSCSVYSEEETEKVRKIVARIHAKGSDAARCPWDAIGKARQNRSEGGSEPALDLLERVIATDRTLTDDERYFWQLNYPLTILQEILPKIAGILGVSTSAVVSGCAVGSYGPALTSIVLGIGRKTIHFQDIRNSDFLDQHGIRSARGGRPDTSSPAAGQSQQDQAGSTTNETLGGVRRPRMQSIHARLRKCLREICVFGNDREKIKKLINEMIALDAEKTPLIFAYSLRSLIDISAHAYAEENNIPVSHPAGAHGETVGYSLASVLAQVKDHIVSNRPNWAVRTNKKGLENALRHCTQTSLSFLSISDLNCLVHDRSSIVTPQLLEAEVPVIVPLIKAMNNGQP